VMWDTWRYGNNTTQAYIFEKGLYVSDGAIFKFKLGLYSIDLASTS
jgi:hypothetical protein